MRATLLLLAVSAVQAQPPQGDGGFGGGGGFPPEQPQQSPPLKVTHEVTFYIAQGDNIQSPTTSLGEIVIGLFGDIVPGTVKNFWHLSAPPGIAFPPQRPGEELIGRTYNSSIFHRVIKGFMIQGGDVVKGDGTGSISLYGKPPLYQFIDENFILKHYGAGWLAMANSGPNTNGCQFYVTLTATPHLDGKHVVFGKVVRGMGTVNAVGNVAVDGRNHRPLVPVWIYSTARRALPAAQQYIVQPN